MTEGAHSRVALNQLTTPSLSFFESLETYARAGFKRVGIWEDTLADDEGAAQEAWTASRFRCPSATPSQASLLWSERLGGPPDLDSRIAIIAGAIERLAVFEPACVVVITGPCRLLSRRDAHAHVVRALRELGDVASRNNTRIALEPIHPSLEGFSYISGLRDALEVIDACDHDSVGLMCDLFHVWDLPDVTTTIRARGDRIFGVQLSDWRNPQRSWADRVLPGDGVAPLVDLVIALEEANYRGDYELEIMSDDGRYERRLEDSLWTEDPSVVASRAYGSLTALLDEAGVA